MTSLWVPIKFCTLSGGAWTLEVVPGRHQDMMSHQARMQSALLDIRVRR